MVDFYYFEYGAKKLSINTFHPNHHRSRNTSEQKRGLRLTLARTAGHVGKFLVSNIFLAVALAAALITMLFVPPDAVYIDYFDFKTLACLFSVLAVVNAMKNIGVFTVAARKIIRVFGTRRGMILALVYITFIGSMFIANDMALLTFLPLGYFVLEATNDRKDMAFTFIMQNIAANLGGMLTPFGNPQNLYIYTRFSVPTLEFMGIMLIPFAVSVTAITLCCFFVKNDKVTLDEDDSVRITDKKKLAVYSVLFLLSVVIVFRVIPYYIGPIVIIPALLLLDREALKKTDYGLLLTFAAFFVFSGNMSRIPAVQSFFSTLLSRDTLLVTALSCQCISNVPTAVLLSQFTSNVPELLMGVNIGGVGTLISSLASLITFREYQKHEPGKMGRYIALFSLVNFAFLGMLILVCELIK